MYWSLQCQQLTTSVLGRSCAGRRGAADWGTHTIIHRSHSGRLSAAQDSRGDMGARAPQANTKMADYSKEDGETEK